MVRTVLVAVYFFVLLIAYQVNGFETAVLLAFAFTIAHLSIIEENQKD